MQGHARLCTRVPRSIFLLFVVRSLWALWRCRILGCLYVLSLVTLKQTTHAMCALSFAFAEYSSRIGSAPPALGPGHSGPGSARSDRDDGPACSAGSIGARSSARADPFCVNSAARDNLRKPSGQNRASPRPKPMARNVIRFGAPTPANGLYQIRHTRLANEQFSMCLKAIRINL